MKTKPATRLLFGLLLRHTHSLFIESISMAYHLRFFPKTFLTLSISAIAMLGLASCGGSSSDNPPTETPEVKVSEIVVPTPRFSQTLKLTINGSALDQGITVVAPFCAIVTENPGSSATQRTYNCLVNAVGNGTVEVRNNAAASLAKQAITVPQPQVKIVTSLGDIVVELNPAKTPITVTNFMKYTNDGFYSNLIFHRVVKNFVVQGGGFTGAPSYAQKATTYPSIALEVGKGLSNTRGTIAMARTNILDSATSQFFINTVDNLSLDSSSGGYAVFGQVVQGLSVVDAINAVPTATRGALADNPVTDVVILSATQTQ